MSQIDKLIIKLLSYPKDFTWEELTKILKHFGYEECKVGKTGGSRRKFANKSNHIIGLHKPHPANILKRYQLDDIIEELRKEGL